MVISFLIAASQYNESFAGVKGESVRKSNIFELLLDYEIEQRLLGSVVDVVDVVEVVKVVDVVDVVDVNASASAASADGVNKSKKPSAILSDALYEQFIPQIDSKARDGEDIFVVTAPIPSSELFESCEKLNGQTFNPEFAVKSKNFIGFFMTRILKKNVALSDTHTGKLIVADGMVILSFRRKDPVAVTSASATLPIAPGLGDVQKAEKYSFPTKEVVDRDIDASIPHKEGLVQSAVYTVRGTQENVKTACKNYGRSFVLTKDQPSTVSGLIRFRVFKENKPSAPKKLCFKDNSV